MQTRKRNVFYRLFFNRADERAYGRFAFFFDTLTMNFSFIFSSGAFYTAFLKLNDISMADVGIMTYMPIAANLSCMFSPFLFRRMKNRKAVLMSARLAYYLFNLVGVALVPFLIHDAGARVFLMAFFLSFANLIWGLFNGGFADWELNFLPLDGTREDFYAYRSLVCALVGAGTQILAGFVATAIETTAPEVQNLWFFWLRVGSILFTLLDVIVFLRVKEYPYPKSEFHLRIRDVIVLPMKNKPFRSVMLVRGLMCFAFGLTSSSWTYYLMDCGLGYSTLSFLSSITPLMSLLLTPFALRLFKKMGCVNNLFFYRLIEIFIDIGYFFVVPSTVRWLYPLMFVLSQVSSVGVGIADVNFAYLFMPEKDRMTYYSFYYASATLMSFFGTLVGAGCITLTEGRAISLFGISLANVQLLMLLQAAFLAIGVLVLAVLRKRLVLAERESLV